MAISKGLLPQTARDDRIPNRLEHYPLNRPTAYGLFFVASVVFLICLPFMHAVFGFGDEGVLLHGAQRLLRGERLYIDFFEILPPGGFVIMATWFGVTGISLESARLLAILTITGIGCFSYLACREACKNAPLSVVVVIAWAVMSQGLLTQISHHWFTTLFSMAAAWASLVSVNKRDQSSWASLLAGFATGASLTVTHTRGILTLLAALASFMSLPSRTSKLIAFGFGCTFVPVCMVAYLLYNNALAAAFDDIFLFAVERYRHIQSLPFGYLASSQNYPLKFLFPVVGLLAAISCARDWRTHFHDGLFRSCVAFGLAGLLGFILRPDIFHIAFAAPLVLPLLTYSAQKLNGSWAPKHRNALIAIASGMVAVPLVSFLLAVNTTWNLESVETPRGRVKLWDNGTRELVAQIAATPTSDTYFFYPSLPMLPFLSARVHVSKYDFLVPDYTSPSQYRDACISAIRHASWLVIDRYSMDSTILRLSYPALRREPEEAKRFERALQLGFEFAARHKAFELRQRVKAVDEAVCEDITK